MFLTHPAPRRMSVELGGGKYYTAAWTSDEVRKYKAAGGWFVRGKHDFDCRATAVLATGSDTADSEE